MEAKSGIRLHAIPQGFVVPPKVDTSAGMIGVHGSVDAEVMDIIRKKRDYFQA